MDKENVIYVHSGVFSGIKRNELYHLGENGWKWKS
jgi:hypothetical protein